jgi:hypothetical protein
VEQDAELLRNGLLFNVIVPRNIFTIEGDLS